ncbi:LPP20 family lipoprotein [Treponema brennaborense]|uniref:Lipoprotein LPP20-like domain-containing protein n=1 Tax=Treponema brennaborense (strain DSM 12168 / CIP 105900 / DD5/3) TaxID=906968 RepID=F4LPJ0_TREBD|nr:LPP20 family lipoprotein [Treponema brennaborense]AEE16001.1 hypothetical protein Trebr_0558 [Treponema brennaborense DSM 12168]
MSQVMRFVFCGLFVCFFAGCASTSVSKAAPLWVSEPDAEYSSSSYLNAVGYGSDRRSAEQDAASALAKSIRQSVVVAASASESFSGSDAAGFAEQYDYSQMVETATTLNDIPGISFKTNWTDKNGTVYVLAQLNRQETGAYYRSRIEETAAVIESELLYARRNEGTFEALAALNNAAEKALQNQEYLDILTGINSDMYRLVSLDYKSAAAVAALAAREPEKIKITVTVAGDDSGRLSAAFSEIFTSQGLKITASDPDARYRLSASVSIEKLDGFEKYEYVRYVLTASLEDTVTGKVLIPYSVNGREAHISQSEAAQRALRTVENEISNKFKPLFVTFLSGCAEF